MALIVEDGTGKVDAESYISVADASTYHSNRGNAAWAALASDAVREQALRKATDYMVNAYRTRWKGTRYTSTQALDWPRYDVPRIDVAGGYGDYPSYYANNVVPTEIANACAELALRASSDDLAPDLERLERRVKVGPIEVEYEPNAAPVTVFRAVEARLAPFLMGSSAMARLVRT